MKFRQLPFLAISARAMPYGVRKLQNYMEKSTHGKELKSCYFSEKYRPGTCLLVTRDKDVNQDQSRINSAGLPCKHGTCSRPAFAPASPPAFLYLCSEFIFVQYSRKTAYLVIFSCFLFNFFVYKCVTIQEKKLQPVSNRLINHRYTVQRTVSNRIKNHIRCTVASFQSICNRCICVKRL